MNKKHKHCELIKAWADGAEIEFYSEHFKRWVIADRKAIHWHPDYEYRLFKPEPKPDVVDYFFLDESNHLWSSTSDGGNLKIIRDGKGKLKSAEVLK